MIYYLLFIIFIAGLFVGSFLNVVIDRTGRNEAFLKGRSYCEFCKKHLGFFDLIPLLSFIFLKGKCRYCKKKLSFQYPIVEIITGFLFLISFIFSNVVFSSSLPFFLSFIFSVLISSVLFLILMIDLKFGIIPDKIILFGALATIVYLLIANSSSFLNCLLSAVGGFLFFLFLVVITKGRGMGMGDAKFAILIGLLLGFPIAAFSFYLAFLTGALVSIILILIGKKRF
jgi:leader peptidase (prepilin peptidase)/N-methyltransferase